MSAKSSSESSSSRGSAASSSESEDDAHGDTTLEGALLVSGSDSVPSTDENELVDVVREDELESCELE